MKHLTIISGGQTGADRAALDWAIAHGIRHSGWCPKGRKAEDGVIPREYQLQETPSASYLQRTEWNVRDSDATIIVTMKRVLTGGSKRTLEFAQNHGKPALHLVAPDAGADNAEILRAFLEANHVTRLNVAGPRASNEPGVGTFVQSLLTQALR